MTRMALEKGGGSRFLYDPFDAATARIDANERVMAERWDALEFRLNAIEVALERLERRLWMAVMGVVGAVLAQAAKLLVQI